MNKLEEKMLKYFEEVIIDKSLVDKTGIDKDYPAFVVDWVVSQFIRNGDVDRHAISRFMERHFPDKSKSEFVKKRLFRGEEVKLIDRFGVKVNLSKNRLMLSIPSLDIKGADVNSVVADEHEVLFSGNAWGVGTLVFLTGEKGDGKVIMRDFKPFQTFKVDLPYYCDQRKHFTVEEWRDMLIRSMEYNPESFSYNEKSLMLYRLVPIVQNRTNFIELAPKGTGKSFVYSRLSKYVWLISGGSVTRAQLLFDMSRKKAGLLTDYDQVVFDEVQSIRFDHPEEIIGALKGYLESGSYKIGEFNGSSNAGLSILGNIPIGSDLKPIKENLMEELPGFMSETAFLDRYHGILPGWDLPRLSMKHRVEGLGLKADYLSEIFHELRRKSEYDQYVEEHLSSSGDIRDNKAVKKICAGLLKLLFPDLSLLNKDLFEEHCLNPAKDFRQRLRTQLSLLDPEYSSKITHIQTVDSFPIHPVQ